MTASAGPPRRRRRGVVLVLVLFILAFVVTLTLALARDVKVELAVAQQQAESVRLRLLTDSAIDRAMAELRLDATPGDTLREPWRDDEASFKGAPRDGARVWWLLTEPDPGDGREVRYGLRDEAGRLDVNFATRDQLLALPGMTEEAADGILDYRDEDDETRDDGAELTYYASLDPPYLPKNTFFEALDELLRVRGVDAAMLYGEDRNRNGLLDPGEDDGDGSFPPDDADGQLDRGLVDYLTIFSRDPNVTGGGQERLVWNSASAGDVRARLEAAGMAQPAVQRLVTARSAGMQADALGQLLTPTEVDEAAARIVFEELTTFDAPVIPGRINVNTAPREVLAGLPGLEDADVDAILTARLEVERDLASPAWLMGVIGKQKLQAIADLVTTRSEQFLVQVVAQLDGTPRFSRIEALVDRSQTPVRVLFRRDLTALGFPFPGERGDQLP